MTFVGRAGMAVVALFTTLGLTLTASASAAEYGDAPVVNSATAVGVTTTAATLGATVTPHENFFEARFSYCRVGVCPDGTVALPVLSPTPEGPGPDPGMNPQQLSQVISGLNPSTEYRVTLEITTDTWDGINKPATVHTFTFRTADPAIPIEPLNPLPRTGAATGVTSNVTTLNGVLIPGTTGPVGERTVAYFEWGPLNGSYPHSTPPQEFPADSNEYPISAGIRDLPAARSFEARLVAWRGNKRFTGAPIEFTTEIDPECPAGTAFQSAKLGRVAAIGCFKSAGGLWVAGSKVQLNGVVLEPVGAKQVQPPSLNCGSSTACTKTLSYLDQGNKLYLSKGGGKFGTTGKWKLSAGSMKGMHVGRLQKSNIDWDGDGPLLSLGADASVDLLDFPLAGQFTFTPHADGSSRLGLLVGMPVALGGVTGNTAVKINPGGDMSFDRIEIEVGEIPVKKVTLGGLRFLYDRSEDVWEGAANITLPTPSAIQVGVAVRVKDGEFNEFVGALDNLNYHIAYGVYLQKVDVLFGLNPIRVGGGMGLSAGPKVAGFSAIGVDGSFLLNMEERSERQPNGTWIKYPPSLQLGGAVRVFSIPVREASVEVFFINYAWVEAEFGIGHKFDWNGITVFGLHGTVGGSLIGTSVDIWGSGALTVADYDIATAKAILNNNGIAACGSALDGWVSVGGYFVWRTGKPSMVWYCDLARLRSDLASASKSAAGERVPVNIPGGKTQAALRFVGEGGEAPQVRLYGPGGRVYDTPGPGAGNLSDDKTYLSLRDELHGVTDIVLARPAKGNWSYEVLPGSALVAEVKTAAELPAVRVKARVVKVKPKVRRGRGGTKVARGSRGRFQLRWNLRRIQGQRVVFSEEGQGVAPRVLLRTRKAKGKITFKPKLLPQRSRRIVATVEQYGRPRARIPVARYTAPRLPAVTKVRRLRAVRRGGRVVVRWRGQAGAGSYRVFTIERNGRRVFRTVKRPRLVIRGPQARRLRAVIVQPVSVTLDLGKRARTAVRPSAAVRKGRQAGR